MDNSPFNILPNHIEPILIRRPQWNETLATQILAFVMQASRCDHHRLAILNEITQRLDYCGLDSWSEIRWEMLVTRIQSLTEQINSQVSTR